MEEPHGKIKNLAAKRKNLTAKEKPHGKKEKTHGKRTNLLCYLTTYYVATLLFRRVGSRPWLATKHRSVEQNGFGGITEARSTGSDFCPVAAKPRLES